MSDSELKSFLKDWLAGVLVLRTQLALLVVLISTDSSTLLEKVS